MSEINSLSILHIYIVFIVVKTIYFFFFGERILVGDILLQFL